MNPALLAYLNKFLQVYPAQLGHNPNSSVKQAAAKMKNKLLNI